MNLEEFFTEHRKAAIAFSGGVDSAYLLYAARQYGADVRAIYVRSAFQPQFEFADAERFAKEQGIPLKVVTVDVLASAEVTANPADRCYHCKRRIFDALRKAAEEEGYSLILDGTNASDDASDRPGMRALQEMSVLSPLRICGLTKTEIRQRSKDAGLFTWDKPAYACLATRIPTGEEITAGKLGATEAAEGYLQKLGFRDFRVRRFGEAARLQVRKEQLGLVTEHREEILTELKKYYAHVLLDMEVRE